MDRISLFFISFLPQNKITIKQDCYSKANESAEEDKKETMRLPQSKYKVNSNRKARIERKIQ